MEERLGKVRESVEKTEETEFTTEQRSQQRRAEKTSGLKAGHSSRRATRGQVGPSTPITSTPR
jgi:hypothetical protein